MASVKVAFLRYLESKTFQQRDLMLQWSLELESAASINYNRQIQQRGLIPLLHSINTQKINLFKRNWKLIRRDFTTTQFFSNNFDASRETQDFPATSTQRLENAQNLVDNLNSEFQKYLELGYGPLPENHLIERRNLFNQLYQNRLFGLCFDLLKQYPKNPFVGFLKSDISSLTFIIDNYGTPEMFYLLVETFGAVVGRNGISGLKNLLSSKEIQGISTLQKFQIQSLLEDITIDTQLNSSIINALNESLSSNTDSWRGKHIIISSIINTILTELHDHDLKIELMRTLFSHLNLNNINFYFEILDQLESFTLLEIATLYKEVLRKPDQDSEFATLLLLTPFKRGSIEQLNILYVWYDVYFTKKDHQVPFDYSNPAPEFSIISPIIHSREPFDKAKVPEFPLSRESLSKFISALIFAFHKANYSFLYRIKVQLELPIERSDKIGYLKSYTSTKNFESAYEFLTESMLINEDFLSDETFDDFFHTLAHNRKWDDLKHYMDSMFEKGGITSVSHYATLLDCLSMRGATREILDLWETFLRKGFTPNTDILCSIIRSFNETKAFSEALQWFSAFSYYKVPLNDKAYSLMTFSLANSGDLNACIKVIEEMSSSSTTNESRIELMIAPIIKSCSRIGNYTISQYLLQNYIPPAQRSKYAGLLVDADYYAGRYNQVINTFYKMRESGIFIEYVGIKALQASVISRPNLEFAKLWKTVRPGLKNFKEAGYGQLLCHYIRVRGLDGLENQLHKIAKILKKNVLPIELYNQMMFTAIQYKKAGLVQEIVRLALNNKTEPNSRTYSLVLRSNTAHLSRSKNTIDNTIQLLDEILVKRKVDRLGKLDEDLNPLMFKFVLGDILKFKGVRVARKYFDLYVESSKNYLLDDIHILHTELLLLGEERRWNDFNACYGRFLNILIKKIEFARSGSEKLFKGKHGANRLEQILDPSNNNPKNFDELKLQANLSTNVGIPPFLKKAHLRIWHYRLLQLEESGRLSDVIKEVEYLQKNGVVLSNDNFNETALALSEFTDLIHTTVEFIDRFLISGTTAKRRLRIQELSAKWLSHVSNDANPYFELDVYYAVLINMKNSFKSLLTEDQYYILFQSLKAKKTDSILWNLGSYRGVFAARRYSEASKSREKHYYMRIGKQQSIYKNKRIAIILKQKLESIGYFAKLKNLQEEFNEIMYAKSPEGRIINERLEAIKSEIYNLKKTRAQLAKRVQMRVASENLEYKVGEIDLAKFGRFSKELSGDGEEVDIERGEDEEKFDTDKLY